MKREPKTKKCEICNSEFTQFRSTQSVCGYKCAIKKADKAKKKRSKERKQLNSTKTQDEKKKRLRRVSKKRAKQLNEYKEIRKEYLLLNSRCERCYNQATEIHHKNGRSGKKLNDTNFFMAICRECHTFIHENPKESRQRGWLI